MPFSGSSLTVQQDTYSKKSTIVMDVSRWYVAVFQATSTKSLHVHGRFYIFSTEEKSAEFASGGGPVKDEAN